MLKKIPVSDLRLGMHLHALEGRWIDHPFWKTRFVLRDSADIDAVRRSSIKECWINVALGSDVSPPATAPLPAPLRADAAAPAPRPEADASAPPSPREASSSMREELAQAAAICKRGRAAVTSMFREARLGQAIRTEACAPLVEDITDSVFRNPGALVSLARLKTRDDYSYMHSVAVCALMVALGRQLGMDEAACRVAGMAGMLHDIGKAVMPLEVLNKPGKLTDDEYRTMKAHQQRGHEMLMQAGGAPDEAMDVCLHHHERIDGKGYPDGLSGEQITRLARMGAICDVYDAVTSNRPYKAGWDPAESIARMASWAGHFDTAIFGAFVKSLGIYPTGSLVRLESGKLAVVVEQNPEAIGAPIVRAFYSTKSGMPIPPVLIDLSRKGTSERIVAREPTAQWDRTVLQGLWVPPDVRTT
ncbi:MAG: HD-GYP domain-containing protein [Rubrivivax sp.]|nr:HD-GYP domain-containing protein [Rubrivivax sp.]